jgi:hypothetical protein
MPKRSFTCRLKEKLQSGGYNFAFESLGSPENHGFNLLTSLKNLVLNAMLIQRV